MNHSDRILHPELLLPAGDPESVRAAVQNGGDAVYLGGRLFSARQNARNFEESELEEAVRYCHARGVKVYQTLNTLLFDGQLSGAEEAIRTGARLGMDAFIVQDWGVVSLIQKICPGMRIHGSTQMAVHTPAGARLLKRMGAKRVVLARELSLTEIREITEAVDIETEVFVHGALCMSLSGQCYMSGMIGGRSGNRGCCAGTCRLPFSAVGKPSPSEPEYALSLKDLCLVEQLGALAEAGVTSLKVEGRMKRPEYVAAAAGAYSAALLGERADVEALKAVFSRSGFTDGYFTGHTGAEMFGFRQKEDVTAATPKVLKTLENSYKNEKGRVPLEMRLTMAAGRPVELTARDADGNSACILGEIPQQAQSRPSSAEGLGASLKKLGGSIFVPGKVDVTAEENLFLPAAEVNRLRREVCVQLEDQRSRLKPVSCRDTTAAELLSGSQKAQTPEKAELRFRFSRYGQIPFDEMGDSLFSLPADEAIREAESLKRYADRLLIEPDRAMFGREKAVLGQLSELKSKGFFRILCNNIAHVELARQLGLTAHGGPFLNCTNSLSAAWLEKQGLSDCHLSFEMNLTDARRLRSPIPAGLVVYGHLPLMLVRNCPIRSRMTCGECGGKRSLTDRTGMRFRVECRNRRYSEIYNGNVLWMGDRLSELEGFSFLTFWFTTEDREECRNAITRYRQGLPAEKEFTRGLYYRSV